MSFPLFGEPMTFVQPDGTRFDARGWGDQRNARFETLDGGEIVIDHTSGYYHYAMATAEGDELRPSPARVGIDAPPPLALTQAPLLQAVNIAVPTNPSGLPSPRWRERIDERQASERLHMLSGGITPAPPSRHTTGDYLGLCLLIDFSDAPATIPQAEVDAFCNQPGYTGFGNNGSVFDYFYDNSGGRLRYRTLVAAYYRARYPKSYYTEPLATYGERTRDLIKEALAHHRQHGFDFSRLTVDTQQRVFATNVFYAGAKVNNWSQGLWPHASRLAAPYTLAPGVLADDYQITSMEHELSLGTYCHENGHMLCDFPDLYRYSNQRLGVGRFCLMCGGGNADKKNPVKVGAYLKYRAGWGNEVVLDAGMRAVARPEDGQLFVHSNGAGEYFIIENRQREGRDAALPGSGLAVWHVDEMGSNSEPHKAPPGHRRHECVLVQADGRGQLDDGSNDGDSGDLFQAGPGPIFSSTSAPSSRWWNGAPSGLQISTVESNGGTIAFSVQL